MTRGARAALVGALLLAVACGADDGGGATATPAAPGGNQRFPVVVDVAVERTGDAYDFTVTISSPYDTPERYADGWRVVGPDGTVYGEHELLHDHAGEQPFTRTQHGVIVPEGVDEVVVEGRDRQNGYGGQTVTVALPDD